MKIIPKDELLSYGFCEFGTEDSQDRYVARNDLIVEEIDNEIGMSFGAAIALMKQGKKVARKGWNGKGMYLWMLPAAEVKREWCKDPRLIEAMGERDTLPCLGAIRMFTATKEVLTGWLASQTDMLAEDWIVVE